MIKYVLKYLEGEMFIQPTKNSIMALNEEMNGLINIYNKI